MSAVEFARVEQEMLWADLHDAVRAAVNGQWSMRAGQVAWRIINAARVAGPTPWRSVDWSLLAGDVWRAVYEAGGIEVSDQPQWDALDDSLARMSREYGSREEKLAEFAGTIAALQADDFSEAFSLD